MNRKERMNAAIAGEKPDRVPVGMWYHFPQELSAKEAAQAHWEYIQRVDLDIIKIMYDNEYVLDQKVEKASDWRKIKPAGVRSPFFQKQRDILRLLVDRGGGVYPVWMTMFGAFKFAVMATSDETVMAHAKEDPEALAAGVRAIAETLCEWAQAYLEEGADAIFYSAQFGEVGRFAKKEWEQLVKPHDLMVLSTVEQTAGKYAVLHLCGEPEYGYKVHIDRFADYPGTAVNWAITPNAYGLERGKDLFARPMMGGLDNHGVMAHGTEEEVKKAVNDVLDSFGETGLILGADCSIESKACEGRIRAAVEATKAREH